MKLSSLFIFVILGLTEASKILVVYPLPVKSLSILGQGIVRHLLNAGHEVTYVTVYPMKSVPKNNFRQIDISASSAHLEDDPITNLTFLIENKIQSGDPLYVQEFATEAAKLNFENENLRKLLENPKEHFDVVIVDLLESEIYSTISTMFDCPMIWSYSMGAHWHVLRIIDEPTNPAYDPDFQSTNMHPLTFTQRLEELWARANWNYYRSFITQPAEEGLYEKYIKPILSKRGKKIPAYTDIQTNVSFIFGNEHNAVKNLVSTPQNFKNIGGFHIEHPPKPLPEDLQRVMDNSKYGVIYFSMGSFWKSKALPKVLVTGLLKTFGELKQTVIWKFEENLPNAPENVHIVNWAPQPSILAHPNLLFFITHGGLLSSIEVCMYVSSIENVHFGVPIVAIPIYFDQFINVNKAMSNGYVIKVDLNYDLPDNLKIAIQEMLSNDKYRTKAKELSSIYHDRPMSPGTELVHWVEHVIRTRGATHLRSPAFNTPLYQKLYLDLLAVLAALLIGVTVLLKKLCSIICPKSKLDKKKTN